MHLEIYQSSQKDKNINHQFFIVLFWSVQSHILDTREMNWKAKMQVIGIISVNCNIDPNVRKLL